MMTCKKCGAEYDPEKLPPDAVPSRCETCAALAPLSEEEAEDIFWSAFRDPLSDDVDGGGEDP